MSGGVYWGMRRMVRVMDFEMNPDFESEMAKVVREATQHAVDATSRAYHENGEQEVEGRLRVEMAQRGITITDDEWLATMASKIRETMVVVVSDPDEFGADAED